jgi:hypothetical protein
VNSALHDDPLLPADVRAKLLVVQEQISPLRTLSVLDTGLEGAVWPKLSAEVVEQLPDPVRRLWRGLDGLKEIGTTLAGPAEKMPDSATLVRRLTDVHAATGDRRLTTALKDALIAKAERGGNKPVARALRDFEPVDVPPTPALPDGAVPLLIPEAPPGGRPAQAESVWEGLPELKDPAIKASRQLTQRLRAQVKWQSEFHFSLVHVHVHQVLHLHPHTKPDERPEEKQQRGALVVVEQRLSRKLSPAEHIIAADMLRRGRNPDEVTAELRRLAANGEQP